MPGHSQIPQSKRKSDDKVRKTFENGHAMYGKRQFSGYWESGWKWVKFNKISNMWFLAQSLVINLATTKKLSNYESQ